jgi:hypothetical protein
VSDLDRRTRSAVEARAQELGLVVRYPAPNQLFIDIDDKLSLERFSKQWKVFTESGLALGYHSRKSPSGLPDRWHITVTLAREFIATERLLLQALLGSDPKRELLSWLQLQRGAEVTTCFFERPEDAVLTEAKGERS